MAVQKTKEVARATLLERLVDNEPDVSTEPRPLRTLDKRKLRLSVRDELQRLLNTRCSYPLDELNKQERTVVNYGISDFSHLSPQNIDDRLVLSKNMEETIQAYEPRLQDVKIIVDYFDKEKKTLSARINAVIVVESIRDPVSFPFVINLKDREFNL